MLGISPVSYNKYSKAPSFGYNKQDVDNDINFYKEQVNELEQFLNEDHIPDKMKKPFKFFRIIANGAIDGLAVFGSTLMLASFIKKSSAKISSNKYVKNTVEMAKPLAEKIPTAITFVGEKFTGLFDKFLKSSIYKRFADTKIGKRIIADTSFLYIKGKDMKSAAEISINKATEPIRNINKDKAINGTAAVLGIGSGITGAYETTMRDDIKNEEEFYMPDYDNDEDIEDNAGTDRYRESA